MIIEYKKECDNCWEDMIHRSLDMTQDDTWVSPVRIDLDFLWQMDFVCKECGTQHSLWDLDWFIQPPEDVE